VSSTICQRWRPGGAGNQGVELELNKNSWGFTISTAAYIQWEDVRSRWWQQVTHVLLKNWTTKINLSVGFLPMIPSGLYSVQVDNWLADRYRQQRTRQEKRNLDVVFTFSSLYREFASSLVLMCFFIFILMTLFGSYNIILEMLDGIQGRAALQMKGKIGPVWSSC
jgi:hypothetical protein